MAGFPSPKWAELEAPSIDDIEGLARRAFKGLPAKFRSLCEDVVIKVEDFPAKDVLAEFGLEDEFGLMGLFQGLGLAQGGAAGLSGALPNMVFLYRRPILDYWSEHHETLGTIVRHVLVHEIGHHFGLSDEDIARIEGTTGP
jgi:predicted Zn-dependent protease with MMP-like domain